MFRYASLTNSEPGQTLLCWALSHSDLSQVSVNRRRRAMKFEVYIQNQISWRSIWPVIRVQNSLPCDGAGVDVQECKLSGTMELKMIQIQNSCTGSQNTSLNRSANWNNQNSPDFICAERIRISLLDAKFDKPSDLTWFWFEFIIKVENKTICNYITECMMAHYVFTHSHLDRTEFSTSLHFWDKSAVESLQWLSLM